MVIPGVLRIPKTGLAGRPHHSDTMVRPRTRRSHFSTSCAPSGVYGGQNLTIKTPARSELGGRTEPGPRSAARRRSRGRAPRHNAMSGQGSLSLRQDAAEGAVPDSGPSGAGSSALRGRISPSAMAGLFALVVQRCPPATLPCPRAGRLRCASEASGCSSETATARPVFRPLRQCAQYRRLNRQTERAARPACPPQSFSGPEDGLGVGRPA